MAGTTTRARRGSTKAAKAEPVEEEVEETNGRGPGAMHELFATYLNDEYDAGITPEQIMLVTSKRNEFRRTDAYADYRDELDKERETRPAKKAKAKAEAAEADEEVGEPEPKPARRGRGRAKAAPAEEPAEEAKPAPRRRRSSRAKADNAEAF